MEFKPYRHKIATWARVLTEADYQERGGIIQTLEGPSPFSVGDYLARNAKGEWPIKRTTIERKYRQVEPVNEEGWAGYMRIGSRLAAQVPVAFSISGMQGKAGDYLVLGGGGGWVVDREIFEATYEVAKEE